VTVGGSALGKAGNDIAADLDRTFAALVDRELGNVRSREAGWNEANACVDVQFNPASLTLKLHRGGHGSVSAQAVAKEGGGASEGLWTRTGQQNATFGPDQADGAAPSFSYDVTNAGKDVVVTLGVRVTSKAGVGEGTWQQETDDLALYRGTVTGTYSVSGGCGGPGNGATARASRTSWGMTSPSRSSIRLRAVGPRAGALQGTTKR
jgi:hypothetical protein